MSKIHLLFGIALVVLAFQLGTTSYLESSEARYVEISREMMASGDYITPYLIHIKHFHKPPLTYWMTAFSFNLFGVNDLAGRIFPLLCALGILLFTLRFANLLFPHRENISTWSFLILLSSLLFLIQARVVTTDIYLAFFTTGAVYFQWKNKFGAFQWNNLILSAAFLALAFLTKGPIPFIFFLFPWAVFNLMMKDGKPFEWRHFLVFLGVFLAIVLPWFLLVIRDNPGLLKYFLVNHTVERYASTVHKRSGHPLYYFAVLLVGMMFWFTYYFPALLTSLKRWKERRKHFSEYLLISYSLVPLLFFSSSGSKLPPYILPALPFFAILLSYWIFDKYKNRKFKGVHIFNMALGFMLSLILVIRPFKDIPEGLASYTPYFFGLLAFILIFPLAYRFMLKNRGIRFETGYVIFNIMFFAVLVRIMPAMQDDLNSFENMAEVIRAEASENDQVVSYRVRLPSLEFYTGIRPVHILHDREIQFEDETSRKELKHYLSTSRERLSEMMQSDTTVYTVIRKKDWRKYLKDHGFLSAITDTLYSSGKYLLLRNSRGK